MPNCRETIRELNAFLDGELPAEVHEHIGEHLGECLDCHQAFDFEAELKQAIRRKCSNDEMPPGLLARIERCFDEDFNDNCIIGT